MSGTQASLFRRARIPSILVDLEVVALRLGWTFLECILSRECPVVHFHAIATPDVPRRPFASRFVLFKGNGASASRSRNPLKAAGFDCGFASFALAPPTGVAPRCSFREGERCTEVKRTSPASRQ